MALEVEDTRRYPSPSKHPKNGWNAAIFIIFVEMAERFAFLGLGANLILYMTNELGEAMPTAAKNVNGWAGATHLLPLLGAFLADSFLGRFVTIFFASLVYCAGMALLALSVSVIPRHGKVWFFVSLYVIAVGQGGHKPCLVTFAADQFADDTEEEKKTKSSFFNWWYMGIAVGGSFAMFGVSYVQEKVGWGAAFGVMAGVMAGALAVFLLGIGRYRREAPKGSPFTSVAQVLVAAARNRNMPNALFHGNTEKRDSQFRFLDKALTTNEAVKDPWRQCSQSQVEEVKQLLRLVPIWLCCLTFTVVNSFISTFFTKQASTMTRTFGSSGFAIPPPALQTIIGVTILLTIPIYDRIIVPTARKLTKNPSGITVLQRIGVGLFFSTLTMVTSALVEGKRVGAAREHGLSDSPMAEIPIRVWWLVPQYAFGGLSDAFTYVGLQELFYAQMPPEMRSLGSAASLSITGIGSFASSGVISLAQAISAKHGWLGDNINRAHLDYFYWVMALLSALNLCVYVWVANGFVYKNVRLEEEEHELQNI